MIDVDSSYFNAPPPLPDDVPVEEMLSQQGAMGLARRLQQYWHQEGYPAARFWAEPINERIDKVGTYDLYRVASNLVNGLPPRYADAQVHVVRTPPKALPMAVAEVSLEPVR